MKRSKVHYGKVIFFVTLVVAAYRDAFLPDSNVEIYTGVIAGMFIAFVVNDLFYKKGVQVVVERKDNKG